MLDVDVDVEVYDCGFLFFDLTVFIVIKVSAEFSKFAHVWAWQQKTTPILGGSLDGSGMFRVRSQKQCNQAKQFRTWKQDPRRCQKILENSGDVFPRDLR